ncbi:MAG: hypothetical protein HYU69_08200 [Bacteroidetes bacterium]|nr:hypothetical protein [Bacteroidota bacterium]
MQEVQDNLTPLHEKRIVYIILFIIFFVTSLLAWFSTGTYESGDSIQHYLIARYSFKHPELFFDHWGKPLFTLLASSFAQFGFFGICLFNISCATATGLVAYKTASLIEPRRPWLAPVFVLFAPIYYVTLISGLTEPLFALVLITGIYFCLKQNFLIAGIIVSFLPFIRTEGFLLLPLFALVFVTQRKYSLCLVLLTGTIIYSVAGWFHYHSLFWIWNENPYKGAEDIYGRGSLFHFIGKNEFILGTPLVILFVLGIFNYVMSKRKTSLTELFLIPGIFFIYLAAHSVFWWKGLYSSLGLIRVMAGVTPLAGLLALKGTNTLMEFLSRIKLLNKFPFLQTTVLSIIIALIIWMPFKQHQFPRSLGYEDEVVKQAADWIKQGQTAASMYCYQYPYLSVFLNLDPFDSDHYTPLWSMQTENLSAGSIVIWDSHFSPNEAKLPLSLLTENSNFELLNTFKADPAKTPDDKSLFEIYIFKRK